MYHPKTIKQIFIIKCYLPMFFHGIVSFSIFSHLLLVCMQRVRILLPCLGTENYIV